MNYSWPVIVEERVAKFSNELFTRPLLEDSKVCNVERKFVTEDQGKAATNSSSFLILFNSKLF